MPLHRLMRMARETRTARYVLVGGSLAVFSAALIWSIVAITALPAAIAAIGAAIVVTPLTYACHRYYTFRSENNAAFEFAAFVFVVLLNIPLGIACVFLFADIVGINPFIAGLLAAAIPPIFNYILHTHVVFAQHRGFQRRLQ